MLVKNPDYWAMMSATRCIGSRTLIRQTPDHPRPGKNTGGNARRTHRCRRPDISGAGRRIAENQSGNIANRTSCQHRRHHRPAERPAAVQRHPRTQGYAARHRPAGHRQRLLQGQRPALSLVIDCPRLKGLAYPYEEWPADLQKEYDYNPGLAKKLLAEAGYPHGFKTNIVADTTGDMVLLDIVKQYFADIGIDMEIQPMDSTEWIKYVLTEHKHDQLAQRTVSPYGHVSSRSGSSAACAQGPHRIT